MTRMKMMAALLLLEFIGLNLDNIAAMVVMMTKMKMMDDTTKKAVKWIDDGCGGGLLVPPEVGRLVAAGIAVVEVFAEGFGAPVVAALSVPEPPPAPVAAAPVSPAAAATAATAAPAPAAAAVVAVSI